MHAVILRDTEFEAFVESLDGDVRIVAYSAYVEPAAEASRYNEVYHSLILSGTRPETKPTI